LILKRSLVWPLCIFCIPCGGRPWRLTAAHLPGNWVSRTASVPWPPRTYCTPDGNELCVSLTDITRQGKNQEWQRISL
jgi:hypothetical protein